MFWSVQTGMVGRSLVRETQCMYEPYVEGRGQSLSGWSGSLCFRLLVAAIKDLIAKVDTCLLESVTASLFLLIQTFCIKDGWSLT